MTSEWSNVSQIQGKGREGRKKKKKARKQIKKERMKRDLAIIGFFTEWIIFML